jgi:hypothetical protein
MGLFNISTDSKYYFVNIEDAGPEYKRQYMTANHVIEHMLQVLKCGHGNGLLSTKIEKSINHPNLDNNLLAVVESGQHP